MHITRTFVQESGEDINKRVCGAGAENEGGTGGTVVVALYRTLMKRAMHTNAHPERICASAFAVPMHLLLRIDRSVTVMYPRAIYVER